jgi:hypothetical protein
VVAESARCRRCVEEEIRWKVVVTNMGKTYPTNAKHLILNMPVPFQRTPFSSAHH